MPAHRFSHTPLTDDQKVDHGENDRDPLSLHGIPPFRKESYKLGLSTMSTSPITGVSNAAAPHTSQRTASA